MRTADIKVGEDYAQFSHKWASARRVTVLETGLPERQGRYYATRTVKTMVRVKFVGGPRDGQEDLVNARTIERLWSEQEVIEQRAKEAREARDDEHRKTAARRANLARRLEDHLAAHGVEVGTYPTRIFDRTHRSALKANGFVLGEGLTGDGFLTRITDLDGLMRSGDVAERDVEFLLADAAVSA